MIDLKLKDNEFDFIKTTHIRHVARAVLLNEKNEVCLLKIKRNDEFGDAVYYETPGGGVENDENYDAALIRELDEEVGVKASIITTLGTVNDYYNLIGRNNINHYFLCKIESKTKIHHASKGDDLINDIIFVDIETAIKLYENSSTTKIGRLLLNREKPVLIEAKEYIK